MPQLSRREYQAAVLVGEGLTNRAIGARLGCSAQVIKNYLLQARRKAKVKTSAQLAVMVDRLRRKTEGQ